MSAPTHGIRVAWAPAPRGADRRAVAWTLVRELMGEAGAEARLSNPCPLCGGPHGPVRIDGAPFLAGVAYAGGLAVAAVNDADEAASFAIDAEPEDASGPGDLLGAGAAIRDWVRVEAALKADGRGLRVDPAVVEVLEDGDGWLARIPGRSPLRGCDLPGPPGILVSAAACAPAAEAEARGGRATK